VKGTVAVIAIKPRECAFEIVGLAIGATDPDEFVAHFDIDLPRPANVIADKQIEIAVVVIIQPRGAGAPVVGSPPTPASG
jgi:hypothetical protein